MWCNSSANGTVPPPLPYTVQTSVSLTLLVGLLILLTVFGNVLVVIAVLTSRSLRAPQNLFLVSLACADVLVATLVMPFSLANELLGYWPFGQVWCEMYLALDVLFCTASIAHLCAISLDRYWSVTKAIEYTPKRTPRRVKAIVLAVWASAGIVSFPPLITMEKERTKAAGPACQISEERWYILFSSTASFFAPCLIMILVYVRIYQIAKRSTRRPPGERREPSNAVRPNTSSRQHRDREREEEEGQREGEEEGQREGEENGVDTECSSSDGKDNGSCTGKKKPRRATTLSQIKRGEASLRGHEQRPAKAGIWKGRRNREKRFTFVLAVVIGVFMVCWFPFFFTYTLTALCPSCCVPETLFKLFFWFGYCNSSLNPVIYTIFNNDFRRSFKKILCRRDRGSRV